MGVPFEVAGAAAGAAAVSSSDASSELLSVLSVEFSSSVLVPLLKNVQSLVLPGSLAVKTLEGKVQFP